MVNTFIVEGSTCSRDTSQNNRSMPQKGSKSISKTEIPALGDSFMKQIGRGQGIMKSILAKLNAYSDYTYTAEYVRKADKAYYNITVLILLMTVYLLGSSPGKYFLYWAVILQGVLYTKRFILFKNYGYHYYLLDYCYAAYVFQSVFVMFYPESKTFYYISFAISGLVHAAFVYKNMYVFHTLDKVTGSILHSFPMIISWNIHWNIRGTQESKEWGFFDPSEIHFSYEMVYEYFSALMKYYALYVIYYYGVQYFRWQVILDNDYYCNLRKESTDPKSQLCQFRLKYGETASVIVFIIAHFVHALFYAIQMLVLFFNSYLQVVYILALVWVLIHRAGTYYIDFFPQQYEKNLKDQDDQGRSYDPLKMRPGTQNKM